MMPKVLDVLHDIIFHCQSKKIPTIELLWWGKACPWCGGDRFRELQV